MTTITIWIKPTTTNKNIQNAINAIPAEYSCKAAFTVLDDKVEVQIKSGSIDNCYNGGTCFLNALDCELIAAYEKTNGKETTIMPDLRT